MKMRPIDLTSIPCKVGVGVHHTMSVKRWWRRRRRGGEGGHRIQRD
jgi:hypothetical protein